MSEELMQKINKTIQTHPVENRSSYFQLKYFIVGKEPTIQSKMWTCLRELKARRDAIDALHLEIADSEDRIELLRIEGNKVKLNIEDLKKDLEFDSKEKFDSREKTNLNIRAEEIKLRQLDRHVKAGAESMTQLRDRLRINMNEARFFLQAFESLEKVEPLKDYDDFESQKDFWNKRLTQDVNLKMLTSHPLDTEMAKTILALNDDAPIKQRLLALLNSVQEKFVKAQLLTEEENKE